MIYQNFQLNKIEMKSKLTIGRILIIVIYTIIASLIMACSDSEVIEDRNDACLRLELANYDPKQYPSYEFRSVYYTNETDAIFVGCYTPLELVICQDMLECDETTYMCFDIPDGYSISIVNTSITNDNYTIDNLCQ